MHEHLAGERGGAAEQVEGQEPPAAHRVFDVVAEDPEKQHVAGYVKQPPCMNIELSAVSHVFGRAGAR